MATTSAKSIRIRNIDVGIDVNGFNATVDEIASSAPGKSSRLPWKKRSSTEQASQSTGTTEVTTSLAKQQDHLIATVTFRSADVKSKALKASRSKWIIDDVFNGVTTLYSPSDAQIE
jgi:hypothetical protein